MIDHITDNILDIVGITETWHSNYDKTTCQWLTHLWTVVTPYIIAPEILVDGVELSGYNVKSRMVCVNPEITLFESMELVITLSSITIQLSVIYRMPPLKSNNGLKPGIFCYEFNDYLQKLSCMNGNIVMTMTMTKFILKIKTSFEVYKRYIYVQNK